MKCANPACVVEFEPVRSHQRFCSESCCKAVYYNTAERRRIGQASKARFRTKHPEQFKKQQQSAAKTSYLKGYLPPWMYT